jgi:hypothetical protein
MLLSNHILLISYCAIFTSVWMNDLLKTIFHGFEVLMMVSMKGLFSGLQDPAVW